MDFGDWIKIANILHKKRAAQNLLTLLTHDIECFGDGHRDLRFHGCSEQDTEISWKVMSFLTLYFFWGRVSFEMHFRQISFRSVQLHVSLQL